jgi:hypothetical protein
MKARVSRAGIEQRIRQIERQLEQGKDGQLWTRRNRDLQGHLAQLRAMFAGRISFAEYLVWADENPGPDAGRTYTYDEEARRRAQFEEFKSQLAHTVERIEDWNPAIFSRHAPNPLQHLQQP